MKYLGSKQRISKQLIPVIQDIVDKNNFSMYIEPFVGGANVIDKIIHNNKIGCDINKYLIALLTFIQNETNLNELPDLISEEEYKNVKENKECFNDWYVGFVGFCCSFGGKFFSGYARGKNNKNIARNYASESVRNLTKQSKYIQDINFITCDYLYLNDWCNIENSLLYCDPPYINTTKYNNNFDHNKFIEWCLQMSVKNTVLISEYTQLHHSFKELFSIETTVNFDSNRITKKAKIEKLFIVNKD